MDYFDKECEHCEKKERGYSETYDAYYCASCKEWSETPCGDEECHFCSKRPANAKDLT